jgi:hypothetical protein
VTCGSCWGATLLSQAAGDCTQWREGGHGGQCRVGTCHVVSAAGCDNIRSCCAMHICVAGVHSASLHLAKLQQLPSAHSKGDQCQWGVGAAGVYVCLCASVWLSAWLVWIDTPGHLVDRMVDHSSKHLQALIAVLLAMYRVWRWGCAARPTCEKTCAAR